MRAMCNEQIPLCTFHSQGELNQYRPPVRRNETHAVGLRSLRDLVPPDGSLFRSTGGCCRLFQQAPTSQQRSRKMKKGSSG
jgi:hypothetical protein